MISKEEAKVEIERLVNKLPNFIQSNKAKELSETDAEIDAFVYSLTP